MIVLQNFKGFANFNSIIKSMFQGLTLSNYFITKLILLNEIVGNNGQPIQSNSLLNARFNLNSSLNLLSKIRQTRRTISQVDWLSIGTATPDI